VFGVEPGAQPFDRPLLARTNAASGDAEALADRWRVQSFVVPQQYDLAQLFGQVQHGGDHAAAHLLARGDVGG
jgi:hypothetical protein